jgi:recombination protein RecA
VAKKKSARSLPRSRAQELVAEINSAMGKPVMTVASHPGLKVVKVPTPSLVINRITGGGFALGRHVELFGDPGVGKSTIMYGTIAMSQRRGKLCGLVDPEGVFDPEWFSIQGGYSDELLYAGPLPDAEGPMNAEEIIGALRLMSQKAAQGAEIEIIGVDSQSAMVTREQVEKDPREEERVASQARMMSRALRVLTMQNRKVLFIWTNQLRSNIGFGSQFNPHVTSGGRAMGFYATSRIEFKKTGAFEIPGRRADKGEMKPKKIKVGDWIQVKSQKEKAARPYAQGAYIFRSDLGRIDLASEIIQLGLEDEIIERSGKSTYRYETLDGIDFSAGSFAKFSEKLMQDDEIREEIIAAIEDMSFELSRVGDDGA